MVEQTNQPLTEDELNKEMELFLEEEKKKSSTKSLNSIGDGSTEQPRARKPRGPPTRKTASNNLQEEIGD